MISSIPLTLTNLEVRRMFSRMIQDPQAGGLSGLARAMPEGDVVSMKEQLAEIMLNSMSSPDGGNLSSCRKTSVTDWCRDSWRRTARIIW